MSIRVTNSGWASLHAQHCRDTRGKLLEGEAVFAAGSISSRFEPRSTAPGTCSGLNALMASSIHPKPSLVRSLSLIPGRITRAHQGSWLGLRKQVPQRDLLQELQLGSKPVPSLLKPPPDEHGVHILLDFIASGRGASCRDISRVTRDPVPYPPTTRFGSSLQWSRHERSTILWIKRYRYMSLIPVLL